MTDNTQTDTFLDYIHKEAFPKVASTDIKECGCVYETMTNGDVVLTHCPGHRPISNTQTNAENERLKAERDIYKRAVEDNDITN